jgi:sulfhydrogenase subunit beta (sulfur reductase)
MEWPAFPCITLPPDRAAALFTRLADERQLWGPQCGADGLWRLQPLDRPPCEAVAQVPFLPLKKLLLPAVEPLWQWSAAGYAEPPAPPALLLTGVALCDLQGLAYLDRAFADDELYRARRARLLVIGSPCVPSDTCACQADGLPPGGDLFWNGDCLWGLSPAGSAIVAGAAQTPMQAVALPGPLSGQGMAAVSEDTFLASAGTPLWDEAAARCLACGACSAVCPTCTCFEVLDEARLDGTVTRQRVWDNCFFPDHARVAGNFDFRPGRGARLRFRFEHKRLGFGALRGLASCVGCGRCRQACPVGIDLEPIARRLCGAEP